MKYREDNSSNEEQNIAYIIQRYQKIVTSGGFKNKVRGNKCYFNYEKLGHFIREIPLKKRDYKKYIKSNLKKTHKRDMFPNRFKIRDVIDKIIKKSLVA